MPIPTADSSVRSPCADTMRKGEAEFRLPRSALFDVAYDQDLVAQTFSWGKHFEQVFGWDDREQHSSATFWFQCVHPEDRAGVLSSFADAKTSCADAYVAHYRFQRKDGVYAFVEEHGNLLRDEGGEVIRAVGAISDVTERKLAATAEQRSMQELRLIINKVAGLLSHVDRELRFTFLNERYAEVFGKPLSEILGRTLLDLHGEAFMARMMPYVTRVLAGETVTFENYFEGPSGRRYGLSNFIPDHDEKGDVVGFFAVVVDITRNKRTEAQLMASEQRFKFAINATEDGLWDWNVATGEVFFAPQWARLLEYEDGIVPQQLNFFHSIIHPDDMSTHRETLNAHLAGNTHRMYAELRLRTKSGEYRWFADQGRIVATDDGGRPTRMVGTISDITAQKQAAAALSESEARYRGLVEWSPEPAVVHRLGKLIYVNPAFVKLVGAQSPSEVMQHSLMDFVHPEFHSAAIQRMQEIAAGVEYVPLMEMRGINLNGDEMFVETKGRAVLYDGLPATHVTIRDITDRKMAEIARAELESQLRESQKMQAIGTLAGGIAHDFNNILTIILGNVELACEDAKDNSLELESLEEIRRAATRARDLVKQILSFSRRQPTDLKPTSLGAVVDEAARLLRATLPARLALAVNIEADLPLVMADPTQIQQVVINLCTNAMQAKPRGSGTIDIRVGAVALDSALATTHPALTALHRCYQGPMQRLTVRDDGPGMSGDTLARIFEPFFTTKAVDEGTGLGLSVVHGIVERHAGAITVESELGRGAVFHIYLPIATPQELSAVEQPREAPLAGLGNAQMSPRLLYIDDDEALAFLVERYLHRRGLQVTVFTEQQAALDAIRENPSAFDIIATDYNMPGMSGLDVTNAVKSMARHLPVIIVSGFVDETLHAEAANLGVKEVVFKASGVEEFGEALRRLAKEVLFEKHHGATH